MKKTTQSLVWFLLFAWFGSTAFASSLPLTPAHKEMQVQVVSDGMNYSGMNMSVWEFRSNLSADDIETFYQKEWKGQMTREEVNPWIILSHRDGEHFHTVQILNGDPPEGLERLHHVKSQGFLAVTDAFAKGKKKPRHGDGFPKPPSSQVYTDIKAKDLGKQSRTMMLKNGQSVNQNVAFYKNHYLSKGWVELVASDKFFTSPNEGVLMLHKQGAELNMTFGRDGGETVITAVLVEQ